VPESRARVPAELFYAGQYPHIRGILVDKVQSLLSKQYVSEDSSELAWSWSKNTSVPLPSHRDGYEVFAQDIYQGIMRNVSQGFISEEMSFCDFEGSISILPSWERKTILYPRDGGRV
jgi:hypothetical protein